MSRKMDKVLMCFFVLSCVLMHVTSSNETTTEQVKDKKITPVNIYRKLLRSKRGAQREAVVSLLKLDDKYDKQYKMVQILTQKIFKVMEQNKVKLTELGYTVTDPFPEEEKLRDTVAIIFENTAFLGEIVLHLPDITHDVLRRHNPDWESLAKWSINFCNETKIFEENDQKMLNLMAQELDIIEKQEDFHNPYRTESIMEQAVDEEMDRILKEQKKKEQKRNKRKKNRGPGLGGGHTEL